MAFTASDICKIIAGKFTLTCYYVGVLGYV